MAKDPAVLFYTSDFISGTQFFTDEQCGQYIRLLCQQHQLGHVPEEHMIIICKSYDSPVWKKFIKDSAGFWYNRRMDEEKEKRLSYSESRRSNRKGKLKEKSYDTTYVPTYDNHMSPHMENENVIGIGIGINPKEEGVGETEPEQPSWKTNFEIYKKEAEDAYHKLLADEEWITSRERYHPNLNIQKSCEKAWADFWLTEAGWKNKKAKKSKTLDWMRTANNALTQRMNQVWIVKEKHNGEYVEKITMSEEEAKKKGYI